MVMVYIDTSALSFPKFLIPGLPGLRDGSSAAGQGVDLNPGLYSFQQAGGYYADFQFSVNPDGTVGFDPAFARFLTVGSTNISNDTLRVGGFPVEIDGTRLSHGLKPVMEGDPQPDFLGSDRVHELTLVPASHYQFQPATTVSAFQFQVTLTGQVVINPPNDTYPVRVEGGNRLVFFGYPVTIDGRRLSHDLLPQRVHPDRLSRDTTHQLTLFPASHYHFVVGSGRRGNFYYHLEANGNITIDPMYNRFLTTNGSQLNVDGFPVVVSTMPADSDFIALVDLGVVGSIPKYLFAVLAPADYRLQTSVGLFSSLFTVGLDGAITVNPAVASSFQITTAPRINITTPA